MPFAPKTRPLRVFSVDMVGIVEFLIARIATVAIPLFLLFFVIK